MEIKSGAKKKIDKPMAKIPSKYFCFVNALIPIMIVEAFFRKFGEGSFKQLYVGSGNKLLKNKYFMGMIRNLDAVNRTKPLIKFIPRYPVATFLAEETDVVLAHQWGNPLNYSYLDAIHFGYPVVHNAEFIKDAGYYYKDFEIYDGMKQLDVAINQHDNNIDDVYLLIPLLPTCNIQTNIE